MTLQAKVTDRYSNAAGSRLAQITNPGASSTNTVDIDRLDRACEDVQSDFEIIAGVAYDDDDGRHVVVAVEGVIAKLYLRTEAPGNNAKLHDAYLDRLNDLKKVTGRNRPMPVTTSTLDPTAEQSGARPDTDLPTFNDFIPNAP